MNLLKRLKDEGGGHRGRALLRRRRSLRCRRRVLLVPKIRVGGEGRVRKMKKFEREMVRLINGEGNEKDENALPCFQP